MSTTELKSRPTAPPAPSMVGDLGIDWTDCPLVESNPLKLSGVPILKHTRLQADAVVENYEDGSPIEEIADNFSISEDLIRQVLAFAATQRTIHEP